MNVLQWLSNPKPTAANPQAINPALPLPSYQITGTETPAVATYRPPLWDQQVSNPFPPRSLVQQPPRLTVIA